MKQCTTAENATLCVHESWVCDEHVECQRYQMENCKLNVGNPDMCAGDGEFWCHLNETCISHRSVCDNVTDCVGAEDEVFCEGECKYQVWCRRSQKTFELFCIFDGAFMSW